MCLVRFHVKAEHIPGKEIVIADMLSRNPVSHYTESEEEVHVKVYVDSVLESQITHKGLDEIKKATLSDPQLQMVTKFIQCDWPKYVREVPSEIRGFYEKRNELSEANGLVVYGNRIIIPSVMKEYVLDQIHKGHMGITKCRERARSSVWWPGISQNIKQKVSSCNFCQTNQPTQRKEPLITTPMPERPWQKVAGDLCLVDNKDFLVITDYFSRYIEIAYLSNITSKQVIGKLKNMFAHWGIPEEFVSDNGSQLVSQEFGKFSKEYGFKCTTSSPHHPQGNGEAESGVKIAKRILKQEDPSIALMNYRATPIEATGFSPCQLMMGRMIRTTLPTLEKNLNPKWPNLKLVQETDEENKRRHKKTFDKRNGVRELPPLDIGDQVRVKLDDEKEWKKQGTVVSRDIDGRTYWIETPVSTLRRNRRHLKLSNNSAELDDGEENPGEQEGENSHIQLRPVDQPDMSCKQPESVEPQTPGPTLPTSTNGQRKTSSGRVINKPIRFIENC